MENKIDPKIIKETLISIVGDHVVAHVKDIDSGILAETIKITIETVNDNIKKRESLLSIIKLIPSMVVGSFVKGYIYGKKKK